MPRLRFNRSIATQLVIANAAMLGAAMLVMSAVFYFGTIGVLDRSIDDKLVALSDRLVAGDGHRPLADRAREIERGLGAAVDGGSQVFLVTSASGQRLAGNISAMAAVPARTDRLVRVDVVRNSRRSTVRLLRRRLPGGGFLYLGRDLGEEESLRLLVWRALRVATGLALVSAIVGAVVFRRQIEARIGEIRRTASHIEAGNLRSRIRISGDDEFARLSVDINRMLDRIEQLVDGVRNVSNDLAHDLRTPLTRIRGRLDEALTGDRTVEGLGAAAETAIDGIDELVIVFNKLLQIAEADCGLRAGAFEPLDLSGIVQDMAELYDASAEQGGVRLHVGSRVAVWACGDHDLLASAVASLIDNAIKYAGAGSRVSMFAYPAPEGAIIVVQDNGPGVPEAALPRLVERFYRLDRARSRPGNGLGLGIVSAIAKLHGGQLLLANLRPGLRASIVLPTTAPAHGWSLSPEPI